MSAERSDNNSLKAARGEDDKEEALAKDCARRELWEEENLLTVDLSFLIARFLPPPAKSAGSIPREKKEMGRILLIAPPANSH